MSGDQEPWVFRGGLTAELQRLIPVDASNDLFAYKTPCVPLSSTFVIRPYLPDDKRRLYDFVMKVADDNGDGSKIYTAHPDLKAEIVTGSFINDANDSITMIIEDDSGIIVGYCFALNNSKIQASRQLENLNQLSEKYPKVSREEGTLLTPCEELLASLSSEPKVTPELVTSSYPSCLTISVLPTLIDDSMSKRLLACVLASLRSQGCFGVHACLNLSEPNTLQFYNRLGFFDVSKDENIVYVGRSF